MFIFFENNRKSNIKIHDEFTNLPMSRQQKYALRMVKRGMCRICGKLSTAGGYCDIHNIAQAKRQRKRNNRKKYYKSKWLDKEPFPEKEN